MQDAVPLNNSSQSESPSSLPIKIEQTSQDSQSWWSLPSSLSSPTISISNVPSLNSFGRSPSVSSRAARAKHPYSTPRDSSGHRQRRQQLSSPEMSRQFGTWSPTSIKNENDTFVPEPLQGQRRSSDGDRQPDYYHFVQDGSIIRRPDNRSDIRPHSSSSNMTSSSLTGAMGDTTMSAHSSPSSDISYHEHSHLPAPQSAMDWGSEVAHTEDLLLPGGVPMQPNSISYFASPTTSVSSANSAGAFNLSYAHNYNQAHYNTTSDPISPESSGFISPAYSDHFDYSASRSLPSALPQLPNRPPHLHPTPMSICSTSPASAPIRSVGRDTVEEEVRYLRNKVRELESENEFANRRVREMQMAISSDSGSSHATANPSGLPSPLPTPPNTLSFQESWAARSNARVRAFCSLNRAGNALCAWHDSRRERRAYPPRMAPPGYLNCGCTYEEALFEESLARHGVGSYHPGESVRMDPALRNPLLKLLQQRFNYRDGEFERDPNTGLWLDGEGAGYWEARAQTGSSKKRADDRRS